MTPIIAFRSKSIRTSLIGVAVWLVVSLLTLWLAHETANKYPWQMMVLTLASAATAAGLLFYALYIVRNALLRKPYLWSDGVNLVVMAPYEIRLPLADIAAYRFSPGKDNTPAHLRGVKLYFHSGKSRYIPLIMAESTVPLVRFMRAVIDRAS